MQIRRVKTARATFAIAATAAIAAIAASCVAPAPLVDLGSLGGWSRANAVNNQGVIVGQSQDADGNSVAFIRDPGSGVLSPIPRLSGLGGSAVDINEHGAVVGSSVFSPVGCPPPPTSCSSRVDHATLYDATGGVLEDLESHDLFPLPADDDRIIDGGSAATAINDAGLVVGNATQVGPPISVYESVHIYHRAFAYDSVSGTVTNLSALGLDEARAVNEHGLVAGKTGNNATVLDLTTGQVTTIPTLGGSFAYATALNDNGLVVGSSQVSAGGPVHAFVYDVGTGVLKDIGTLPGSGTLHSYAYGVNNNSLVVGSSTASGGTHAFVYDGTTGSLFDLGTLGTSTNSQANDVNDGGVIVGFSQYTPSHAWRSTFNRP